MKNLTKTHFDPEGWTTNAVESDGLRKGGTDSVFANGYSKSGVSTDIGMQLIPSEGYVIGLSILNLVEPNMGLKDSDTVSREVRLGVARSIEDISISADLSSRKFADPLLGISQSLLTAKSVAGLLSGSGLRTWTSQNSRMM